MTDRYCGQLAVLDLIKLLEPLCHDAYSSVLQNLCLNHIRRDFCTRTFLPKQNYKRNENSCRLDSSRAVLASALMEPKAVSSLWHNDQHSPGLDQLLFLLSVVNASICYAHDAFRNIGLSLFVNILQKFSK